MTDSPAPDGLAPGGGTVIPGDPGNAAGPADPEDPAAQPGAAGGPASPAAPQTGSAQQAGAAERADADAQTAAAPAPPRGASAGRPVRGRPPIKGQPAPAPPGPEAAAAPGTPAAAQATGAGGPGTAGGAAPPTGTVAPKAPERPASPNPPSAPPAAAPPAARPADGLLPAPAGAPDASPASPGAPNAFKNLLKVLKAAPPLALEGRVTRVAGLVIEGSGPAASVGEICLVDMPGGRILEAEAVGFKESAIQLMPIGDMTGLTPGSRIRATGGPARVDVGPGLLGRVLDGRGRPMDGKGPAEAEGSYPVRALPGSPMDRARILEPVDVGVRCINALLTLGRGQRVGIFAGSGVGKSTLMGMIARHMKADVNVIALVGERGREVREFIEKDLGPEGLARSVVVAATSEQPALVRMRGAYVGTAIAEYFRDCGKHVILMMDSATRFAYAAREVGLSVGEPATTRGYTPSVFAMLPQLLERAGAWGTGSITGIYTVLVEGDDMNEPVADSMRSILDGHLVLRREMAARNIYPAVDILSSISRLMTDVTTKEHRAAAARFKDVLAVYTKNEDMVNIGAYQKGASRDVDEAVALYPRFVEFLKQPFDAGQDLPASVEALMKAVASPPQADPGPGGPGAGHDGLRRRV